MTDVRHKLHNYILENSQKLPPRVFQPLGASTLAHGWVRTVRTAQNLQNADIQWAERGVEADFVHPKLCIPGRLNQNCGHGASIRIACDGPRTSVGSPRRFDDIAPAHRRTPKCAVGRRSRSGLIVRSGRSTSFGRSPRLVPRSGRSLRAAEGAEAVGRGQPFHTALRAGVVLSHPKKLVCWGPGSALAVCRFSSIQILMGPRMSPSIHATETPYPRYTSHGMQL